MTAEEFVRWVLALDPEANAPGALDEEQAYCFRRVREEAVKVILPPSETGGSDE